MGRIRRGLRICLWRRRIRASAKRNRGKGMKTRLVILLVAGTLAAGVRVYAHHSFAATYFDDKKVTVEGELVQFLYRNPHSFIQVETKDTSGQTTRWAVEWAAGGQLGRQ